MELRVDRLRERLEFVKRERGLSPRQVSLKVGGSPDLVRHLLNGDQRDTKGPKLMRLAAVLECSVDYLYGRTAGVGEPPDVGEFQMNLPDLRLPRSSRVKKRARVIGPAAIPSLAEVPEYDIQLSAGGGALIADETVRRYWGLPVSFLDGLGLDPRQIAFVEIIGDSMAPVLMPGDLVLLDLRSRNPALPAIYALWDGDATVCKRVEKVAGSTPTRLRIISENKAYTTYEILAEDANVIGRVAWFSRRT